MSQNAERLIRNCPVCHASPGVMCMGPAGQEELEVHRERPYWSSSVNQMVLPHPAAAAKPQTETTQQPPRLEGYTTKLTPDHVLDRLIQAGPGQTLYGVQ